MDTTRRPTHTGTGLLLLLVMANITMQLINASIIKYATGLLHARPLLVLVLLGTVLTISFGRFLLWGAMHKRYPVSVAYPAMALFFPFVVALAYAYGEPVTTHQALGAGMVTLGIILFLRPTARREPVA